MQFTFYATVTVVTVVWLIITPWVALYFKYASYPYPNIAKNPKNAAAINASVM